jgi:hypothetical protein
VRLSRLAAVHNPKIPPRKPLTSNSMEAITTTVGSLSDYDARVIAESLTKTGSEFQKEVTSRNGSHTPIAVVRDGSWRIVSWAATHTWRNQQTLEGFTIEPYRRRGIARVCASLLVADGSLNPRKPLAVFASQCVEIARSVGFREIRLYEFRDGDWFENS